MRIAYAHDWLTSWRGGEKVLAALLEIYPDAPIYTLFYDPEAMPASIRRRDVRFPRSLNPWRKFRKALLPILPAAAESLPLESYDLIISTSSCVMKGVMTGPQTQHICYIHSPMRYIWDQRSHYLDQLPSIPGLRAAMAFTSSRLREWDVSSSNRVDRYVANSSFVAARVRKYYRRPASVLAPPVELDRFLSPTPPAKEDYFLAAGAFVPYKRFDLAIQAAEKTGTRLIVAGSGPDAPKLRKLTRKFASVVEAPDDHTWIQLMRGAKGLIFPGVEDFGIVAIEALASGTPLLALEAGGALDFVRPGETGAFFAEESVDCLSEALANFRPHDYDHRRLTSFASTFGPAAFVDRFKQEIQQMAQEERTARCSAK